MRPRAELLFLLALAVCAPAAPSSSPAGKPAVPDTSLAPATPIKTRTAGRSVTQAIKEIKGDVLATACFTDKDGEHCIIVWGRNNKPGTEDEGQSELFAAKYTKASAGFVKKWSIKDFAYQHLSWVAPMDSIRAFDADGDGRAETVIAYAIDSDGMDPSTVKLLVHSKDKKYAIRGKLPKHMGDLDQYEKKPDPSLQAQPPKLRSFADARWDALVGPAIRQLEAEAKDAGE